MTPAVRTYGQKKRYRIDKKFCKNSTEDTPFSALNMESIKMKKAEALEQYGSKRNKKKKKDCYPKAYLIGDADTTFDRLVKEGPISYYKNNISSATEISFKVVDGSGFRILERSRRQTKRSVRPKSRKKRDESSYHIDVKRENLHLEKSCSRITIRKKAKLSEKKVNKSVNRVDCGDSKNFIQELLEHTSTSTPLKEWSTLEKCKLSPISVDINCSYESQKGPLTMEEINHSQQSNTEGRMNCDITCNENQGRCTKSFSPVINESHSQSMDPFSSFERFDKNNVCCSKADLLLSLGTTNLVQEVSSRNQEKHMFPACHNSSYKDLNHITSDASYLIDVENISVPHTTFDSCGIAPQACYYLINDTSGINDSKCKEGSGVLTGDLSSEDLFSLCDLESSRRQTSSDGNNRSPLSTFCEKNKIYSVVNNSENKNYGQDLECYVILKRCDRLPPLTRIENTIITDPYSNIHNESLLTSCTDLKKSVFDSPDKNQENIRDIKDHSILLKQCDSLPLNTCTVNEDHVDLSCTVQKQMIRLETNVCGSLCESFCDKACSKNPSKDTECSVGNITETFSRIMTCSNDFNNTWSNSSKLCVGPPDNNELPCSNKDSSSKGIEEHSCSSNPEIAEKKLTSESDSLILKPGKQWRRSLSILSKVSDPCKSKAWKGAQDMKVGEEIISKIGENELLRSEGNLSFQAEYDESIVLDEDLKYNANSLDSAGKIVLGLCSQNEPFPFASFYPPSMRFHCEKIGEGVYGEVFSYCKPQCPEPTVIKVIPIEGKINVNGEPQKKFKEIASEICIAQQLSHLRNSAINSTDVFNEVQAVRCVKGCYPDWLTDLWIDYDERKGSENDSPTLFEDDQLFIILELSNGGKDVESFVFKSAEEGLAAFQQVALALSVGERALSFEHRDLHWGNVLVSGTDKEEMTFVLDGQNITCITKGIKVSIIDFTLSHIKDPVSKKPIFNDLSKDETLFLAHGDYQFDIYRLMKQYCGGNWAVFSPKTNIAWLHYLLDKLCSMARYRNRSSRRHKHSLDILFQLKDKIFEFDDAFGFVTMCEVMKNLLIYH